MKELLSILVLLTAACQPSLNENGKLRPFEPTSFFADHSSARPRPEGVISRAPTIDEEPAPTMESLLRGKEQFQIFCQVCHGADGRANGMAVQRGFPRPVNLMEEPMLNSPTQVFYETMTNGYGRMFSYANRIPQRDRWAIAQYIRVLQLQQHFPAAGLSPQELRDLKEAK
jgi:mono/diheme cytochrome c family protein